MAVSVAVLDYGSGNLRSAERALQRVGADVTVTADRSIALAADGLVIPGVGAFAACMKGLLDVGAPRLVSDRLRTARPMLGICVGMQTLFEVGVEHGVRSDGLGVLPGRVTKLCAPVLPHMGWNTVTAGEGSALFTGLDASTRFYFVHSYGVHEMGTDADPALARAGTVSTTEHGERFVSAIESGVVAATQFHPEKSGDAGATLLENWLATLT